MACAARTSRWESPSSGTNSIVAPSSAAARSASVTRCSGWPCVAASPREHTTKCAARPARVSCAITPPQPNSMSSGCAPKASTGGGSGREFGIGFIGSIDLVPADKGELRRFLLTKIGLFARAGHVMGASQNRLHPAEPSVPRGADLLLGEGGRREDHEGIAARVQSELVVMNARADDLAFVWHVHEEVADLDRAAPQRRVAGARDVNSVEQPHAAIHLQTEVRHRLRRSLPEQADQAAVDVIGQL